MQSDLVAAKSELDATRAQLINAERAYAIDASPGAWKSVAASRDASDKAATRLRVLEAMAEEQAAADAAREIEAIRAELADLESRENLPAATDDDLAAFRAAIAELSTVHDRVGKQLAERTAIRHQANDLRAKLGLSRKHVPLPEASMELVGSNAYCESFGDVEANTTRAALACAQQVIANRLRQRDWVRSKRNDLAMRRRALIDARDNGHRRQAEKLAEALRDAEVDVARREAKLTATVAALAQTTTDNRTKNSREANHAEAASRLEQARQALMKARDAVAYQAGVVVEDSDELKQLDATIALWAQPGGHP